MMEREGFTGHRSCFEGRPERSAIETIHTVYDQGLEAQDY